MRLPKGALTLLASKTGLRASYLSDLVCAIRRPSRKRAVFLENVCRDIYIDIDAMMWLYGSSKNIKAAILKRRNNDRQ